MATDESNIGVVLGLICVALALLPWIPFDIWLKRHGHEYITVEVREQLAGGGWGGLLFCGTVGFILAVAAYHFLYQRALS